MYALLAYFLMYTVYIYGKISIYAVLEVWFVAQSRGLGEGGRVLTRVKP